MAGVDIEKTVAAIQAELEKDKTISPTLKNLIGLLILVLQMMTQRLSLNSSNSSLPPSTDKVKRRTRRTVAGKKKKKKSATSPGGQPGHEGSTLTQFPEPDEIVELSIDQRTLPQRDDYKSDGFETRQVINIVLDYVVTEYQAEVLVDGDGNRYTADFPDDVTKAIQYGGSVKALSTYLSQYQLLPYARVQEVFKNCFDLPISQGSICNFNKEAYEKLDFFEEEVKETLKNAEVLNADETGIQIGDTNHWMHVLCTPKTTYFFPHEKRGQEAMHEMGVLDEFSGVLCHDHWKPYFGMTANHALCNAHHIRELEWVIDFKGQKWAKSMKRFLIRTKDLAEASGGVLSEEKQKLRIKAYRKIIAEAKKECPMTLPAKGSGKKKAKQTKERNLLDRLEKYEDAVLLFMKQKNVPFTNNQAERDIRMVKVHQKVSGHFRSMAGARYFCRTRGYLLTNRKRGLSPFTVLGNLFYQ